MSKDKLTEETAKSIKSEKQLEKMVESNYGFYKDIFRLTDDNILTTIKSITSISTEVKKEDW